MERGDTERDAAEHGATERGTAERGATVRGRVQRDWRTWAWIAIAVVAAFVIGFAWQGIRATQLDRRLGETQQALTLNRLETTLAAATFEAQRGSYEIARQHASDFFTGLQRTAPGTPVGVRARLAEVQGHRDHLITLLSRGDPEAGGVLWEVYTQYRAARIEAEQALPRAR